MNITPSTLGKIKTLANKIAVYDVDQKKAVLIFKSLHLCAEYLFWHMKREPNFNIKVNNIVSYCLKKKTRDEKNTFGKTLCFRLANDEQKEILNDNDLVILDEDFRNTDYYENKEGYKTRYNQFSLDSEIQVGDTVELLYGKKAGLYLKVKEVVNVPGGAREQWSPAFVVDIDGKEVHLRSNVLAIVKKATA